MLRIIARMNLGGPAYHVSLLGGRLDRSRYESLLLAGSVGPGEESYDELADRSGARWISVPFLGPELSPAADARALWRLVREIRRFRPDIVHTHAAKAGTLGRVAALLAGRGRPIIVHTYHGHVLRGYFGPARNAIFRSIERALGLVTDCLVGVSRATVDDLVELRIAPARRFRVVPLGLDLARFDRVEPGARGAVRTELGVADDDVVVTFVGRLVPIKRVDRLVDAVAEARRDGARLHLAVVGDGALRAELEEQVRAVGLERHTTFLGYRRDLEAIAAATDVGALSSASEGTPVSLIEAAAAGRPLVATDVGGVRDVVVPGAGFVVSADDVAGFAAALAELAADPALRERMGAHARAHVRERFGVDRLVADVEALYDQLLERR